MTQEKSGRVTNSQLYKLENLSLQLKETVETITNIQKEVVADLSSWFL